MPTHDFLSQPETMYYVSAPCGWGKTLGVRDYIAKRRYRSNHMYVAPSLELLNRPTVSLRTEA